MNCVEKLREYADATKWGGECRILHAHHGDFAGDCSERECNECRAAYLRAIADEMQENMRDAEARLMPEGLAWPMFEDGEPVRFGDRVAYDGNTCTIELDDPVDCVSFHSDGDIELCGCMNTLGLVNAKRVKRPKVLDADGVEIRVGDTVYYVDGREQKVNTVARLTEGLVQFGRINEAGYVTYCEAACVPPDQLTHRAPVLDADGKPIEVGKTYYGKSDGAAWLVEGIDAPKTHPVLARNASKGAKGLKGEWLTLEPTVIAADGEPLEVGQTVYVVSNGHGPFHIDSVESDGAVTGWSSSIGSLLCTDPTNLTHQRPVLDADGVPIKVGDTLWRTSDAHEFEVTGIDGAFMIRVKDESMEIGVWETPRGFTHTKPEIDSWQLVEQDAKLWPGEYAQGHPGWAEHDGRLSEFMALDLVRRAKKLAGVDNG